VIEHQRYSLNPTLTLDDRDGTVLTIQAASPRFAAQATAGLPGAGTVDRSAFTIRPDLFPGDPRIPKTTSTYDGLTVRLDRTLGDIWSMDARRSASAR